MSNCSNCQSSNPEYHLCSNCYNNIFKSLYCDGHCGRKCDPSQRTGNNIIALPWWWYCETCRKKRENPNLPPDQKRDMTEDERDRMKKLLDKGILYTYYLIAIVGTLVTAGFVHFSKTYEVPVPPLWMIFLLLVIGGLVRDAIPRVSKLMTRMTK